MIYLDNAATTYPKPRAVPEAIVACMQSAGGNPGRSGHDMALAAGETVYACREAVCDLVGATPEQVVFTMNATQALNIAIKSMVHRGDHVLISDLEHNAVRRPVAALREEGACWGIFKTGEGDPDQIEREILRRLRPRTSLLVCTHASNICSMHLPVARIGRLCRERGIKLIVDASQSAGNTDLKLSEMHADALCAPGHKGLYGPQGTGFAVFGARYLNENGRALRTRIEGGGGVDSVPEQMPAFVPERMEAGTLPVPALAGLTAGIRSVLAIGEERIGAKEKSLFDRMAQQLGESRRIHIYRPETSGSVLLFSVKDMACEEVAKRLNEAGICVRSGLHCAPLAHRTLGTPADGAVRVSFSMYNTEDEIDRACAAILELR